MAITVQSRGVSVFFAYYYILQGVMNKEEKERARPILATSSEVSPRYFEVKMWLY